MEANETIQPETKSRYDPESFVVTSRHVRSVVGLSMPTIWRLRRKGLFPEPFRLSPGKIAWYRTVLVAWLAERQARK